MSVRSSSNSRISSLYHDYLILRDHSKVINLLCRKSRLLEKSMRRTIMTLVACLGCCVGLSYSQTATPATPDNSTPSSDRFEDFIHTTHFVDWH